jgi:hypothetical protein
MSLVFKLIWMALLLLVLSLAAKSEIDFVYRGF